MQLDTIYNEDCLEGMRRLPDNAIDLIATDPPYFRVKGESWDRQWDSSDKFIDWIGELCQEWQRVLKSNGSLYVFASRRMSGRVEAEIEKRFAVVNRITWNKPAFSTKAEMFRKADLRSYFPVTEEIIFAEHHGSDNIAKGEAGYAAKCDQLRGFVFEPLRAYLDSERKRAGVAHRLVITHLGMTGHDSHFFSAVQWKLPLPEQYQAMRILFSRKGVSFLTREYEELRSEYEELRRPFSVSAEVPFTDVWTFPTVQAYKGKHPCEKPLAMMEHIVRTSSRPGAVVLDCFLGSGTTAVACINTGRHYVGFEKDPKYFDLAQTRIQSHTAQLALAA